MLNRVNQTALSSCGAAMGMDPARAARGSNSPNHISCGAGTDRQQDILLGGNRLPHVIELVR